MVDAGARLLSLINQQVADGISVVLDFEWPNESMGYLNRAGFFRLLPSDVEVRPARPDDTLVTALMGNSSTLVEFRAIAPDKRDTYDVPRTLSATLKEATRGRADARLLNNATFTILAELIDNIYQHSQTRLDGYAALQVYAGAGNSVRGRVGQWCGVAEYTRTGPLPHRAGPRWPAGSPGDQADVRTRALAAGDAARIRSPKLRPLCRPMPRDHSSASRNVRADRLIVRQCIPSS